MLTILKSKKSNSGTNNGQFKTGLNTFRIESLEDLLGTKWISVLKKVLKAKVKVNENGCWNWTGALDVIGGYGTMMVGNRPHMTHRLFWTAFRGSNKGLCVLHRCDNPKCGNPSHLFLGTKTDNAADRDKKLRQSKGEKVNTSKLTTAQVL